MPVRGHPAPNNPDKPLLAVIVERIRSKGPLSVADYMRLALDHPEHGYYHARKYPFGAAGDFVTAPEISQVFGELLGLWLATAWQGAGSPGPFRLVELGPGRGQLMVDLLRATVMVPGFVEAADVHLVESSQRLRTTQREALPDLAITWHDRLESLPAGPLFLIANEFVDALPAHQLTRTDSAWSERLVDWQDRHGLVFTEGAASPALTAMIANGDEAEPDQIAEVSPARSDLAKNIGERLARDGGIALIIDYGAWAERPTGDTLQAVRDHQPVNPLSTPGEADVTTQVDFHALGQAAAAAGAAVFGPVPQGTFLRTLGIEPRIAALLQNANDDQRRALRSALFRLTDGSAMGEMFKALVLASPDSPLPPGFQAPTLPADATFSGPTIS